MKLTLTLISTVLFHFIQCYDSESIESYNGIEVSPFYDAIIFSDIADIVNEFENNNIPITNLVKNESESDEDVDDLLSEYQNYLEKAHTQTKSYIEKSKLKNKVPMIRHEKHSKNNLANNKKHEDYIYKTDYYSPDLYKFPKPNNPLDLFLPLNNKGKLFTINEHLPRSNYRLENNKMNAYSDMLLNEENKPLQSSLPKKPNKSSCYCKNNQLPCACGCKQCLLKMDTPPFNHLVPKTYQPMEDDKKPYIDTIYPFNNFQDQVNPYPDSKASSFPDDTLNIRIKVDVQLPTALERRLIKNQIHDNADYDGGVRDYFPNVKVPTPYFNFPIPMNAFGYKKSAKLDSSPFHKITIHKKKRTKTNNSNKKHRKKIITFHNIKIEPQQLFEAEFGKPNENLISKNISYSMNITTGIQSTNPQISHSNVTTEKLLLNPNVTETHKEENLFLLVNISNNSVNGTDDMKTENSIETDYTNTVLNTTDKAIHLIKKREAGPNNESNTNLNVLTTNDPNANKIELTTQHSNTDKTETSTFTAKDPTNAAKDATEVVKATTNAIKDVTNMVKDAKNVVKDATNVVKDATNVVKDATNTVKVNKDKKLLMFLKKIDKSMPSDEELLYWPENNETAPTNESKNITTIILEHEHKKDKINISGDALRNNHTRVLEKAIFGDADWNAIDTVAPAFISFVGKYTEGVLTFCNDKICHSMKCGHEKCIYRVCKTDDRLNHKGHCTGLNSTDSVTTMESIMDLPSNVAFEIVDILEERMVGKLFGKSTLCINSKCITFAASKKTFLKNKCTLKELNVNGHCKNMKEVKVNKYHV